MSQHEYIFIGTCIWCLKSKPEVTFRSRPHTIPRTLNAHNIGFDICDSCNSYFGSDNQMEMVNYSIDKIVKEFFNVHKLLLTTNKDSNSWKQFRSQFFNYYHSGKILKINIDYVRNPSYASQFTRKFKRGIYNIFLQEYHRHTKNALEIEFDRIRDFARNDKGDLPLYYLKCSNGIRIVEDLEISHELPFNDFSLQIMKKYGFYYLSLTGLNFYLAATPNADLNYNYIVENSDHLIGSGFVFDKIIELKRLNQIDFTLRNWNKT